MNDSEIRALARETVIGGVPPNWTDPRCKALEDRILSALLRVRAASLAEGFRNAYIQIGLDPEKIALSEDEARRGLTVKLEDFKRQVEEENRKHDEKMRAEGREKERERCARIIQGACLCGDEIDLHPPLGKRHPEPACSMTDELSDAIRSPEPREGG